MTADGLGVDTAIEAVGIPDTFTTAVSCIRPGGTIANVGVHGAPVEFPIQRLWIENITLRTGLVSGSTISELLDGVLQEKISPERFTTHRYGLGDILEAYSVFGDAPRHKALKVVLSAS